MTDERASLPKDFPTKPINAESLKLDSSSQSEQELLQALIDGDNLAIPLVWPRHSAYDIDHDGSLSSTDILFIPSIGGNPEAQSIFDYSEVADEELVDLLLQLPDSKVARILSRKPARPRRLLELFALSNPTRAANVVISWRENPYSENPYKAEGFTAAFLLKQLPTDTFQQVMSIVDNIELKYADNIRKATSDSVLTPNKSEYPWSTEPVEAIRTEELQRFEGKPKGKKIFQGQYSVAKAGDNLLTFGVNDCVAIGLVDNNGNKALSHLDVGMDDEDSLDQILFSFVKVGGDLSKTKLAMLGGYEHSKRMIWNLKQRLQQAGLSVHIQQLLSGDSKQLLITDDGFRDFDFYDPITAGNDRMEMRKVLERIDKEGNGRIATLI